VTTTYESAQDAFLGQLERVITLGHPVTRRTDPTVELVGEAFVIEQPLRRCITVPHRRNNVAASIAESVWMLAGRDDVAFLAPYLPRAGDYSDDDNTWRGAYGPRLRRSFGVDQLAEVRNLLVDDPQSRRAVASIFDPAMDFVDSRDIPCNNWLHFIVVDGALDLSIAARSIDLMWGFSGADAFQWSVLQELMARWVGVPMGQQRWFIGSCHLYARHLRRGEEILKSLAVPVTQTRPSAGYEGIWEFLKNDLDSWFEVESLLRSGAHMACAEIEARVVDPLLQSFAVCLAGFWDLRWQRPLEGRLSWLGGTELGLALEDLARWL